MNEWDVSWLEGRNLLAPAVSSVMGGNFPFGPFRRAGGSELVVRNGCSPSSAVSRETEG